MHYMAPERHLELLSCRHRSQPVYVSIRTLRRHSVWRLLSCFTDDNNKSSSLVVGIISDTRLMFPRLTSLPADEVRLGAQLPRSNKFPMMAYWLFINYSISSQFWNLDNQTPHSFKVTILPFHHHVWSWYRSRKWRPCRSTPFLHRVMLRLFFMVQTNCERLLFRQHNGSPFAISTFGHSNITAYGIQEVPDVLD